MQIIMYDGTQEEYDTIVAEKTSQGLTLTNVQNITEGNFLGFMKTKDLNNDNVGVVNKLTQIETRLKAIEEGQDSLRSLSK